MTIEEFEALDLHALNPDQLDVIKTALLEQYVDVCTAIDYYESLASSGKLRPKAAGVRTAPARHGSHRHRARS